jgi:hypothetical protein
MARNWQLHTNLRRNPVAKEIEELKIIPIPRAFCIVSGESGFGWHENGNERWRTVQEGENSYGSFERASWFSKSGYFSSSNAGCGHTTTRGILPSSRSGRQSTAPAKSGNTGETQARRPSRC